MEQRLVSYEELERITGIKRNTLYAMVSRRTIPHVRLGRRLVRFELEHIERWLAEHAVASTAK